MATLPPSDGDEKAKKKRFLLRLVEDDDDSPSDASETQDLPPQKRGETRKPQGKPAEKSASKQATDASGSTKQATAKKEKARSARDAASRRNSKDTSLDTEQEKPETKKKSKRPSQTATNTENNGTTQQLETKRPRLTRQSSREAMERKKSEEIDVEQPKSRPTSAKSDADREKKPPQSTSDDVAKVETSSVKEKAEKRPERDQKSDRESNKRRRRAISESEASESGATVDAAPVETEDRKATATASEETTDAASDKVTKSSMAEKEKTKNPRKRPLSASSEAAENGAKKQWALKDILDWERDKNQKGGKHASSASERVAVDVGKKKPLRAHKISTADASDRRAKEKSKPRKEDRPRKCEQPASLDDYLKTTKREKDKQRPEAPRSPPAAQPQVDEAVRKASVASASDVDPSAAEDQSKDESKVKAQTKSDPVADSHEASRTPTRVDAAVSDEDGAVSDDDKETSAKDEKADTSVDKDKPPADPQSFVIPKKRANAEASTSNSVPIAPSVSAVRRDSTGRSTPIRAPLRSPSAPSEPVVTVQPPQPPKPRTKGVVPAQLQSYPLEKEFMRLAKKTNSLLMAASITSYKTAHHARSPAAAALSSLSPFGCTADRYGVLTESGAPFAEKTVRMVCATRKEIKRAEHPASFFGVAMAAPPATTEAQPLPSTAVAVPAYETLQFARPEDRDFYQKRLYGTTFVPQALRERVTLVMRNARYVRTATGMHFNLHRDKELYATQLEERYTMHRSVPHCDIMQRCWQTLVEGKVSFVYLHYMNKEDAMLARATFTDDDGQPLIVKGESSSGSTTRVAPSPLPSPPQPPPRRRSRSRSPPPPGRNGARDRGPWPPPARGRRRSRSIERGPGRYGPSGGQGDAGPRRSRSRSRGPDRDRHQNGSGHEEVGATVDDAGKHDYQHSSQATTATQDSSQTSSVGRGDGEDAASRRDSMGQSPRRHSDGAYRGRPRSRSRSRGRPPPHASHDSAHWGRGRSPLDDRRFPRDRFHR